MKNKSAVLFSLGLMVLVAGGLHAAANQRGAKGTTNVGQSTNPIGVSSATATLYSVIVGTGAVTDFVTLFDSASVSGLTSGALTGNFKARVYPSSATQNTQITFDPPLLFKNGIIAIPATALVNYLFVWESGRAVQGQ